jgi:predicted PurR-regulated permease PerM
MQEQLGDALDEPFVYIRGLIEGGAGLIASLLLIFLYTFLLLLYRQPIYHFILGQFGIPNRRRMEFIMADTQRMSYTYLKGLVLVMVLLGFLNSLGLTLIGLEYAFFWGFFAAFLAIIPYVGTFLGGLMPFLYALSTTDTTWQPVAVVALFTTVQAIEGNIITPKIVGSSIQVNPLAAILALFIGGFVWGVEGLILALPVTAMLRIIMVHSGRFRPIGLLLSDELQDRESEFLTLLDKPHYRIINLFRTQAPFGQGTPASAKTKTEGTN